MRVWAVLAGLGAGLIGAIPAAAAEPAIEWQARCPMEVSTGARCGVLNVPEDRAAPNGRSVGLGMVLVPGEDRQAEPIFFIAGGPGQSAIDVMPATLEGLRAVDRRRDILFLDQRGTGRSAPLTCENGFDLLDQGPSSPAFARCVSELRSRADLDLYGSAEAVADLEAARRALGRERVNLVAASYGTRVALFYMREHPERVRAAVLRAAAPLDFNIIGALTAADATLGRVMDDCAANAACAAAYARFEQQVREVSDRLARAPQEIVVRGTGGLEQRVPVTQTLFHQILYALMLTAPGRQQIPYVVSIAAARGFQPLSIVVGQIRNQLYGVLPVGMYLSVICSEDAPRLGQLPPGRTPLASTAGKLTQVCDAWPVRARARNHLAQPRLAVPTLILSGEFDPATTVEAAGRLSRRLARSRHIVMPATAHGPMLPECVRAGVRRFLESASVAEATADCSGLRLPAFALPPAAQPARN